MTTHVMGSDGGRTPRARSNRKPSDILRARYQTVRALTSRLCDSLEPEDFVVQSMPDVSPTKWHLAHTSWFFETFLLKARGFTSPHDAYAYIFNSYYNGVGDQFPRSRRGMLSRPSVGEVQTYRAVVDDAVLSAMDQGLTEAERGIIELGLHHEQQHQELLLTDIKHVLSQNPLWPSFGASWAPTEAAVEPMRFVGHAGGEVEVGRAGDGFHYDNEGPRHRTLLPPFALGHRLVTVGEYRDFVRDGGYERPELWLDAGWHWAQQEGIVAPLYWDREDRDGCRRAFTLSGRRPLEDAEPVVHVSLFEADAYARWADARLPREHELEVALRARPLVGNFVESEAFHPRPACGDVHVDVDQLWGDGWEWTQSSYLAYPGYRPPKGAVGEYNGKFMCNQHVLRGGSCASSRSHLRATYRNFFPASARWQFTCIRIARDL